jgi:hypothetical protein
MQTTIYQGVTTVHPQLKALERWSSGHRPDITPHILWTTGQRMTRVDANAYFQGSFERLSVVQPCWTTGQRTNQDIPHIVVPTVHRIDHVDANACFQRGFLTFIRWNARFPTVHRLAVGCRRTARGACLLRRRHAPRAVGPPDPLARWRGGVILLEFVGKNPRNPPRQNPCFWWRGGGRWG